MTARAVYVAVREFLFTGVTDVGYLDIKGQRLAGQWVVAIHVDVEATDF
jgi:hypothetical protein